ncbi:hypothetical protein BCR34DRAFT_579235 [Clohesyomyces aquaticus]|uniref:NB-ARC domain-containing protein n=1 Tax=Clohesyomyces aquaticus TaxID=1231657 RepID=A0A1Y1YBX1_9PLEO|nr:hypothetical protein BCR34DRAFT_579235 [Clohesyomyces aquaticus]
MDTISCISAIVQLVDFSCKVCSRIDELKGQLGEIPRLFAPVKAEMGVVKKLITELDSAALKRSNLESEIEALISSFEQQLQELDRIIEDVRITRNTSLPSYMRRAISTVHNDTKTRQLIENLRSHAIHLCSLVDRFDRNQEQPTEPRYFNIGSVPTAIVNFVGREDEIEKIQTHIKNSQNGQATVVLQGIGGQGKTQLALEVTRRLFDAGDANSVVWVDATSEAAVLLCFEKMYESIQGDGQSLVDPTRRVQASKRIMAAWTTPWIFVVDNYDNPKDFPEMMSHLPKRSNASVLFISRNTSVERLGNLVIKLPGLDRESAARLLLDRSQSATTETNNDYALQISERLAFLALAIDQAGAFCLGNKLPLSAFLEQYDRKKTSMFRYTPDGWEYRKRLRGSEESSVSVYTTWEMSIDSLDNTNGYREHARDFLRTCAFIDYTFITDLVLQRDIWEDAVKLHGNAEWQHLFRNLDGSWNSTKFEGFIHTLSRLSLTIESRQENGTFYFSIHPLIAEWLRLTSEDAEGIARNTLFRSIHLVTATLKQVIYVQHEYSEILSMFPENKEILGHIIVSTEHCQEYLSPGIKIGEYPFLDRDGFYYSLFFLEMLMFNEAAEYCDIVYTSRKSILGDQDEGVWTAYAFLGKIEHARGNLWQAKEIRYAVYERRKREYGDRDFRTISAGIHYARNCEELGESCDVMSTICGIIFGSPERSRLYQGLLSAPGEHAFFPLLSSLVSMGAKRTASQLCEDLFALKGWSVSDADYWTLLKYAGLQHQLGHIKSAISILPRFDHGCDDQWGPEHPYGLLSLTLQAKVLELTEAPRVIEEAERDHKLALCGLSTKFGPSHPAVLATKIRLAGNLFLQNRRDEWFELMQKEVLPHVWEKPSLDMKLQVTQTFAAGCYVDERFKEAEAWHRKTIELLESDYRDPTVTKIQASLHLGLCLSAHSNQSIPSANCACVRPIIHELHSIVEKMSQFSATDLISSNLPVDAEHDWTGDWYSERELFIDFLDLYCMFLENLGHVDFSASINSKGLILAAQWFGKSDAQTIIAASSFEKRQRLCPPQSTGRLPSAGHGALLQYIVSGQSYWNGDGHPSVLRTKELLAFFHEDQGRDSECCRLREEIAEATADVFGPRHINTGWARYREAVSLLRRDMMENDSAMSILIEVYASTCNSADTGERELALACLEKQEEVLKHARIAKGTRNSTDLKKVTQLISKLRAAVEQDRASRADPRPYWCACEDNGRREATQDKTARRRSIGLLSRMLKVFWEERGEVQRGRANAKRSTVQCTDGEMVKPQVSELEDTIKKSYEHVCSVLASLESSETPDLGTFFQNLKWEPPGNANAFGKDPNCDFSGGN